MPMPNHPLKVLHLTAGSDAGGVSRYVFNLCSAMHDRGHEVAIAGEHGAASDLFDPAPWPWRHVPMKGGYLTLRRVASQLCDILDQYPVDLLHAHYRKASLVGRWLARRFHVPLLFTLHVTGIPMRGAWRWWSDFGDHAHAPAQMARQWLINQARLSDDRITVIPHGINPDDFPVANADQQQAARKALDLPGQGLVAAFVGRFDRPKNEEWMLDLARRHIAHLPDLHVVLIGEGPNEPGLRQRIERDGLTDRVTIMPYGDPLPVYRAADAVLLPSSEEGFSFINTEAMSVGRPVLRTCTAGTAEHIVEGVTGRSVPVDREAFLGAAAEFLADREELSRMGQAAAEHVRANLTFDHQLDRTLTLYRRLVDEHAA